MAPSTAAFLDLLQKINSVNSGPLIKLAADLREIGARSNEAGSTLAKSATEVGNMNGAPYAAYQNRLQPVATWMNRLTPPATEAADALVEAGKQVNVAQAAAAQWVTRINTVRKDMAVATPTGAAALQAVEEEVTQAAVADLTAKMAAVTAAYAAITPADSGAAPTQTGTGDAAADPAGTGQAQNVAATEGDVGEADQGGVDPITGEAITDPAGVDPAGVDPAGVDPAGVDPGGIEGAADVDPSLVGPTTGEYAGWVQDPLTGNLIDPATGREVNAEGRFVDPITGMPFGDPSQYASRLEGLEGGISATGGLLAPAGAGIGLGAIGGAGGGGVGGFGAGMYGGMVPPSMMGNNPASGQLRARAERNLAMKAETATRYAGIASGATVGQPGHAYLPPMGGAAGGGAAGGGGRQGRRNGRGLVAEPSSVWGATGRGNREGRRTSGTGNSGVVEDADVWTSGSSTPGGALGGR